MWPWTIHVRAARCIFALILTHTTTKQSIPPPLFILSLTGCSVSPCGRSRTLTPWCVRRRHIGGRLRSASRSWGAAVVQCRARWERSTGWQGQRKGKGQRKGQRERKEQGQRQRWQGQEQGWKRKEVRRPSLCELCDFQPNSPWKHLPIPNACCSRSANFDEATGIELQTGGGQRLMVSPSWLSSFRLASWRQAA